MVGAVHLHVGQDVGDGDRMLDVGLARGAQLALVRGVGQLVDAPKPSRIEGRVVRPNLGDQIVGERIGCAIGVVRHHAIEAGRHRECEPARTFSTS